MSYNLQSGTGSPFALPRIRVIELTGRDAPAFAQSQFMNDVLSLASGRWQWNGWLTPKGRVIALFALALLDDERLWLVLPDADPDAFAAALRRFVFRSKVTIGVRGDLGATGSFAPPVAAAGADLALLDEVVELDAGTESRSRALRLGPVDERIRDSGEAAWMLVDLQAGLPRLGAAQVERWTPQQLSLERLGAFSVKKGCYPGQEIVARTHFLGQAKRGLALFEADGPITGTDIEGADGAWGAVVSAASHAGRHLLLGVGSIDALPDRPTSAGVGLRALPLDGGLAR